MNIASPNVLTFQLVMGRVHFFVMGAHIPPTDMTGVDDLRAAWANCPTNCKPLLLGVLNINFGSHEPSGRRPLQTCLTKSTSSTCLTNSSNDKVDNREGGRDGLGGNGGGDNGISHSQTTAWLGMGTQSFFVTRRFRSLDSMIRIIGLSLHQLQGDGPGG